ncbi:hypothetical protein [Micromonospora ureilytica]|uniref:hypothetical protein n=1 Tax=Micromonospora ureilytica TaxID=709868 RepID=UPI0040399D2A
MRHAEFRHHRLVQVYDAECRWGPDDDVDDGEEILSSATLRFRTEAALCDSLTTAGFLVDRVHGGWHGEPVGRGDGEFVVLARVGTLAPVF